MTPRTSAAIRAALLACALAALTGCDSLFPAGSQGERLYRANCAECHGRDGAGNTPRYMGNGWADLRDNEWKTGGDSGSIQAVIEAGVFGEMPGYEGKLSTEEIRSIVDYLRELRGEKQPGPGA